MRGNGSFQLVRREIFLSLAEERYRHRVKMEGEFEHSTILDHDRNQAQTLRNVLEFPRGSESLLYRGSRDGWCSADFHGCCDDKGPTVTLIKVENAHGKYIFGGYTDKSWDCTESVKRSEKSFLFSLVNAANQPTVRMPLISGKENQAIYCSSHFGPIFGLGPKCKLGPRSQRGMNEHDLQVCGNLREDSCYTTLNHCYRCPPQQNELNFLAGGQEFTAKEIEVYGIRK